MPESKIKRRLGPARGLTPEERNNVRRAVRTLCRRYGSASALAPKLRAGLRSVQRAMGARGAPSMSIVLRCARLVGVGVDDLLSGKWPKPGACPTCGQDVG